MNELAKSNVQRYEQTRIINLMGHIEDVTKLMFHQSFPDLQKYYENEVADHTATISKITRFRCKLHNLLKALEQ